MKLYLLKSPFKNTLKEWYILSTLVQYNILVYNLILTTITTHTTPGRNNSVVYIRNK